MVNEKIDSIIKRIHGKYPEIIWVGKEYSTADLIVELEEIQEMLKSKKRKSKTKNIEFQSTIICPECGHSETENMATDSCQWFYDCKGCGAVLKPKSGDCCVYCSYGSIPCPSIQVK